MHLVSVRLITDDVARMAEFYEHLTGQPVVWSTPDFAELRTPAGTLAIASTRTVALFGEGSARPADNRTAIIEFLVSDVDAEYVRLGGSRSTSSTNPRPCPGATDRCWSVTPTATWSTCSHRSHRPRKRSSAADGKPQPAVTRSLTSCHR